MKRPTSISLISVLFLIVGAVTGFQILNSLFNNHLYLDSSVLMIPVGLGLLKGRSSSRGWAKFWIALFAVISGILLLFYPFLGGSYTMTIFGRPLAGTERHLVAVGLPVLTLLLARWMWRILTSPATAPFFDDYLPRPRRTNEIPDLPFPPTPL